MDQDETFGGTPVHRRAFARLRTKYPAKLILLSGNLKGFLLDLSATGAKVILDECEPLRGEGVLQWAGFEGFGEVKWAEDTIIGFEFLEDLPADALESTRDLPKWTDQHEMESYREYMLKHGGVR